jgi:DNA-binding HxlR family transcriptional regulator
MMRRRTQSDCPVCYALDLFGDKWTLLIIRDMLIAEKRQYRDFLASEEGIATNVLADRMKTLVENGFVTRQANPQNRTQAIYLPTEKAQALMPVIEAMIDWASAYGPGGLRTRTR